MIYFYFKFTLVPYWGIKTSIIWKTGCHGLNKFQPVSAKQAEIWDSGIQAEHACHDGVSLTF